MAVSTTDGWQPRPAWRAVVWLVINSSAHLLGIVVRAMAGGVCPGAGDCRQSPIDTLQEAAPLVEEPRMERRHPCRSQGCADGPETW